MKLGGSFTEENRDCPKLISTYFRNGMARITAEYVAVYVLWAKIMTKFSPPLGAVGAYRSSAKSNLKNLLNQVPINLISLYVKHVTFDGI